MFVSLVKVRQMPVKAQISAGTGAGTIGRRRKRRPSDEPSKAYTEARVEQIRLQTELHKLRLGRMNGTLIDRKLLVRELTESFTAIRDIILASSLPQTGKETLLQNLAEIPVILMPGSSDAPASSKSI